ncbi:Multidomain chromatinic protein with the following architecture: 3x PHD-bromo-3xPHD-SET domain and associated cysteine cluster at the C-terminus, related [Neospora caninum Liverpool]|nr:Multidomain chromatinic protein with the following architecture: 3x PHD-bromo-3xPHD-SET domain and associated cysteine cluster at the C-terminus, related [Neospora caninum Liverpool]CBZ54187.1 Multidomain chromatinic protein with the following architecture: 3x PHD-bromo-3xPHD-SET domain and associated cysteine cluster at the C-terminus, related [Neospora caninum Liverpool]|eukprot:XP_003884218.1 Multidomain chromatinic protein with the following architecture: 3x PHD-bromo-3xPHD-SET domain and associated cysteine cluster at the C-terminus, related [Neospora caninum Liverpool]
MTSRRSPSLPPSEPPSPISPPTKTDSRLSGASSPSSRRDERRGSRGICKHPATSADPSAVSEEASQRRRAVEGERLASWASTPLASQSRVVDPRLPSAASFSSHLAPASSSSSAALSAWENPWDARVAEPKSRALPAPATSTSLPGTGPSTVLSPPLSGASPGVRAREAAGAAASSLREKLAGGVKIASPDAVFSLAGLGPCLDDVFDYDEEYERFGFFPTIRTFARPERRRRAQRPGASGPTSAGTPQTASSEKEEGSEGSRQRREEGLELSSGNAEPDGAGEGAKKKKEKKEKEKKEKKEKSQNELLGRLREEEGRSGKQLTKLERKLLRKKQKKEQKRLARREREREMQTAEPAEVALKDARDGGIGTGPGAGEPEGEMEKTDEKETETRRVTGEQAADAGLMQRPPAERDAARGAEGPRRGAENEQTDEPNNESERGVDEEAVTARREGQGATQEPTVGAEARVLESDGDAQRGCEGEKVSGTPSDGGGKDVPADSCEHDPLVGKDPESKRGKESAAGSGEEDQEKEGHGGGAAPGTARASGKKKEDSEGTGVASAKASPRSGGCRNKDALPRELLSLLLDDYVCSSSRRRRPGENVSPSSPSPKAVRSGFAKRSGGSSKPPAGSAMSLVKREGEERTEHGAGRGEAGGDGDARPGQRPGEEGKALETRGDDGDAVGRGVAALGLGRGEKDKKQKSGGAETREDKDARLTSVRGHQSGGSVAAAKREDDACDWSSFEVFIVSERQAGVAEGAQEFLGQPLTEEELARRKTLNWDEEEEFVLAAALEERGPLEASKAPIESLPGEEEPSQLQPEGGGGKGDECPEQEQGDGETPTAGDAEGQGEEDERSEGHEQGRSGETDLPVSKGKEQHSCRPKTEQIEDLRADEEARNEEEEDGREMAGKSIRKRKRRSSLDDPDMEEKLTPNDPLYACLIEGSAIRLTRRMIKQLHDEEPLPATVSASGPSRPSLSPSLVVSAALSPRSPSSGRGEQAAALRSPEAGTEAAASAPQPGLGIAGKKRERCAKGPGAFARAQREESEKETGKERGADGSTSPPGTAPATPSPPLSGAAALNSLGRKVEVRDDAQGFSYVGCRVRVVRSWRDEKQRSTWEWGEGVIKFFLPKFRMFFIHFLLNARGTDAATPFDAPAAELRNEDLPFSPDAQHRGWFSAAHDIIRLASSRRVWERPEKLKRRERKKGPDGERAADQGASAEADDAASRLGQKSDGLRPAAKGGAESEKREDKDDGRSCEQELESEEDGHGQETGEKETTDTGKSSEDAGFQTREGAPPCDANRLSAPRNNQPDTLARSPHSPTTSSSSSASISSCPSSSSSLPLCRTCCNPIAAIRTGDSTDDTSWQLSVLSLPPETLDACLPPIPAASAAESGSHSAPPCSSGSVSPSATPSLQRPLPPAAYTILSDEEAKGMWPSSAGKNEGTTAMRQDAATRNLKRVHWGLRCARCERVFHASCITAPHQRKITVGMDEESLCEESARHRRLVARREAAIKAYAKKQTEKRREDASGLVPAADPHDDEKKAGGEQAAKGGRDDLEGEAPSTWKASETSSRSSGLEAPKGPREKKPKAPSGPLGNGGSAPGRPTGETANRLGAASPSPEIPVTEGEPSDRREKDVSQKDPAEVAPPQTLHLNWKEDAQGEALSSPSPSPSPVSRSRSEGRLLAGPTSGEIGAPEAGTAHATATTRGARERTGDRRLGAPRDEAAGPASRSQPTSNDASPQDAGVPSASSGSVSRSADAGSASPRIGLVFVPPVQPLSAPTSPTAACRKKREEAGGRSRRSWEDWVCADCATCRFCCEPLSLPPLGQEACGQLATHTSQPTVNCHTCNMYAHGVCCYPPVPELHPIATFRCDACTRCRSCGYVDLYWPEYANWDIKFQMCSTCHYAIEAGQFCPVCMRVWGFDGLDDLTLLDATSFGDTTGRQGAPAPDGEALAGEGGGEDATRTQKKRRQGEAAEGETGPGDTRGAADLEPAGQGWKTSAEAPAASLNACRVPERQDEGREEQNSERRQSLVEWVLCDGCRLWVHAKCDGLSEEHMEQLACKDVLYRCPVCRGSSRALKYKRLLDQLVAFDKTAEFTLPAAASFTLYWRVVTRPMDLTTMRQKLQRGEYKRDEEIISDLRQIFHNARMVNMPNTRTYRSAVAMERKAHELLVGILQLTPGKIVKRRTDKTGRPGLKAGDERAGRDASLLDLLGDSEDIDEGSWLVGPEGDDESESEKWKSPTGLGADAHSTGQGKRGDSTRESGDSEGGTASPLAREGRAAARTPSPTAASPSSLPSYGDTDGDEKGGREAVLQQGHTREAQCVRPQTQAAGAEAKAGEQDDARGLTSCETTLKTHGRFAESAQKQPFHVHRLPEFERLPIPPPKPLDALEDLFMLPSGSAPVLASPSTVFPVSFACGFPLAPSSSLLVPQFPPTFQLAFSANSPLPAELPCAPHPVLGAGLAALGCPEAGEGPFLWELPTRRAFAPPKRKEKTRKKKDAAEEERRTKAKGRDAGASSLFAGAVGQAPSASSAFGPGEKRKKRGRKPGKIGEKTGAANPFLPAAGLALDRTEEEESRGASAAEGFREPSRSPESDELPGSDEEDENEDADENGGHANARGDTHDNLQAPGILPKCTYIMPAVENPQEFLRAIEDLYGDGDPMRKRRREDKKEREGRMKAVKKGARDTEGGADRQRQQRGSLAPLPEGSTAAACELEGPQSDPARSCAPNTAAARAVSPAEDKQGDRIEARSCGECSERHTEGAKEARGCSRSRRSSLSGGEGDCLVDAWGQLSLFEDCCALCGSSADATSLYHCPSCGESFHAQCIGVAPPPPSGVPAMDVECPRCAVCVVCDGRAPCVHIEDVRNRRSSAGATRGTQPATSCGASGAPAFFVSPAGGPNTFQAERPDLLVAAAASALSPTAEALRKQFHVYRCGSCGVCAHADCVWHSSVEAQSSAASAFSPSPPSQATRGQLPAVNPLVVLNSGTLPPQFRPQIPQPWMSLPSSVSFAPSLGASPLQRLPGGTTPESSGGAAAFGERQRPACPLQAHLAGLGDQEKFHRPPGPGQKGPGGGSAQEGAGVAQPLDGAGVAQPLDGAGVAQPQAVASGLSGPGPSPQLPPSGVSLASAPGAQPGVGAPASAAARQTDPGNGSASRASLVSQLANFLLCLKLLVRRLGWRPTAIAPLLGSTPETLHRVLLQLKLAPSSLGEEGQNVLQWCFLKAVEAKETLPGFEGVRLPLPSDVKTPTPTIAEILPRLAALRQSLPPAPSSSSSAFSSPASVSASSSAGPADPSSVAVPVAAPGAGQPRQASSPPACGTVSSASSLSSLPLQPPASLPLRPGPVMQRTPNGVGAPPASGAPTPSRGATAASLPVASSLSLAAALPFPASGLHASGPQASGPAASDPRGGLSPEQLLLSQRLLQSSLASSHASAGSSALSSGQAVLLLQHLRETYRDKQRVALQQAKGLPVSSLPRDTAPSFPQASAVSAIVPPASLSASSSDSASRGGGADEAFRKPERTLREEAAGRRRPDGVATRESREPSPRGSRPGDQNPPQLTADSGGETSAGRSGLASRELPARDGAGEGPTQEVGRRLADEREQRLLDSTGGDGDAGASHAASMPLGSRRSSETPAVRGEAVRRTKPDADTERAHAESANRFDTASSSVYPEAEVLSQLLSNCFPSSVSSSPAFPEDPEVLGDDDDKTTYAGDQEQRRGRGREVREEPLHRAAFCCVVNPSGTCEAIGGSAPHSPQDSETDERQDEDEQPARTSRRRGETQMQRRPLASRAGAPRAAELHLRDSSLAPPAYVDIEDEGRARSSRMVRDEGVHASAPPSSSPTSKPSAPSPQTVRGEEPATGVAAETTASSTARRTSSAGTPQADAPAAAARSHASSLFSSLSAGDVHKLLFSSSGLALMTPEQQLSVLRSLQRQLAANAPASAQLAALASSVNPQGPAQAPASRAGSSAPLANHPPCGGDTRPDARAATHEPQTESERLFRAALQRSQLGGSPEQAPPAGVENPTRRASLLQIAQQLRAAALQSSSPASAALQEKLQALLNLQQQALQRAEGSQTAPIQAPVPGAPSPPSAASASRGQANSVGDGERSRGRGTGDGGVALLASGGLPAPSKKRPRSPPGGATPGAAFVSEAHPGLSGLLAAAPRPPAPGSSPSPVGLSVPNLSPPGAVAKRESGAGGDPLGHRHAAGSRGNPIPAAGRVPASSGFASTVLKSSSLPPVQMKAGVPGPAGLPQSVNGASPSSLHCVRPGLLPASLPAVTSASASSVYAATHGLPQLGVRGGAENEEVRGLARSREGPLSPPGTLPLSQRAADAAQPLALRPSPPLSRPSGDQQSAVSSLNRTPPKPGNSVGPSSTHPLDNASLFLQESKTRGRPFAGAAAIPEPSSRGVAQRPGPTTPALVSPSGTQAFPPLFLQNAQLPYLPSQQASLSSSLSSSVPALPVPRLGIHPAAPAHPALTAPGAKLPEPGRPDRQRRVDGGASRAAYPTALFHSSSPGGAALPISSLGTADERLSLERLDVGRSRGAAGDRGTGLPDARRQPPVTGPQGRLPQAAPPPHLHFSSHVSPFVSLPGIGGAAAEASKGRGDGGDTETLRNNLRKGTVWCTDWAYPGLYVRQAPRVSGAGGATAREEVREGDAASHMPPLLFCGGCWRKETGVGEAEAGDVLGREEDRMEIIRRSAVLPQQLLLLPESGYVNEAEDARWNATTVRVVEKLLDQAPKPLVPLRRRDESAQAPTPSGGAGERAADALEAESGTDACLRPTLEGERERDIVVKCGFCGRLEGFATASASLGSAAGVPGPVLVSLRAAARRVAASCSGSGASKSALSLERAATSAAPVSSSEASPPSAREVAGGSTEKEASQCALGREVEDDHDCRGEETRAAAERKRSVLLLNGLQGVCAKCWPLGAWRDGDSVSRGHAAACVTQKTEFGSTAEDGREPEDTAAGFGRRGEHDREDLNARNPFCRVWLFQVTRTLLTAAFDVSLREEDGQSQCVPPSSDPQTQTSRAEAVTFFAWLLLDAVLPAEAEAAEKDSATPRAEATCEAASPAAPSPELRTICMSLFTWFCEQPACSREIRAMVNRLLGSSGPATEGEKKDLEASADLDALLTSLFTAFAAFAPADPVSLAICRKDRVSAPGSAAEGQAKSGGETLRQDDGHEARNIANKEMERHRGVSEAALMLPSSRSFLGAACLPPSLGVSAASPGLAAHGCLARPSMPALFAGAWSPEGKGQRGAPVLEFSLRCNLWLLLELAFQRKVTQAPAGTVPSRLASLSLRPLSPDTPSLLVRLVAQRLWLGDALPTNRSLSLSSRSSSLLACQLCGETGDRLVRGRLLPFGDGVSLHSECIAWSVDPVLLPSLANPRLTPAASDAAVPGAQAVRVESALTPADQLKVCVDTARPWNGAAGAETVPTRPREVAAQDREERAGKRPKTGGDDLADSASNRQRHTAEVPAETAGSLLRSSPGVHFPASLEPFLELSVCLPPVEIPSEEVGEVVADAAVSRCVWCMQLGASVYCSAPECSVKLHLACAFAAATNTLTGASARPGRGGAVAHCAGCGPMGGCGDSLQEEERGATHSCGEEGERTKKGDAREDPSVRVTRKEREQVAETRKRAFPIHILFSRRQIWCHACWKGFVPRPDPSFDPLFLALEGLSGSVCFIIARQLSQSIRLRPPCSRLRDLPTAEQEASRLVAASLLPVSAFFSHLPSPLQSSSSASSASLPTGPLHFFSFTPTYGPVESLLAPLLAFLTSSSSLLLPSSPSSSLAAVWSQKVALYTKQKNLVSSLAPFLLRSPSLLGALVASVDSRQVMLRLGKMSGLDDAQDKRGPRRLLATKGRDRDEAELHRRPTSPDSSMEECLFAASRSDGTDEELFQLRQQTLPQGDFWLGGTPRAAGSSAARQTQCRVRRGGEKAFGREFVEVLERVAGGRQGGGREDIAGKERHRRRAEPSSAFDLRAEDEAKTRGDFMPSAHGEGKDAAQASAASPKHGRTHPHASLGLSSSLFSGPSLKRLSAALAPSSETPSSATPASSSTLSPSASPPACLPAFSADEKRHRVIRHGGLTVLNVGIPLSYEGETLVYPIGFVSVRRFHLPPCLQTPDPCRRRAAKRQPGADFCASARHAEKTPRETSRFEARPLPTRASYVCAISLRDGRPFFTIDILASSLGHRAPVCACLFSWLRAPSSASVAALGSAPPQPARRQERDMTGDAEEAKKDENERTPGCRRPGDEAHSPEKLLTHVGAAAGGASAVRKGNQRSEGPEAEGQDMAQSCLAGDRRRNEQRDSEETRCSPVWGWRLAEGDDLEETFSRFVSLFHLRPPRKRERDLPSDHLLRSDAHPEGANAETRSAAKRQREGDPEERERKKTVQSQQPAAGQGAAGRQTAQAETTNQEWSLAHPRWAQGFSTSGYTFFGINSPYVVDQLKPKIFDVLAWRALSRLGDAHHNRLGVLLGNCHRMEQWERRWPTATPALQTRAGGRQREAGGEPQLGVPRDLLTHPLEEDTQAENLDELMVCSFNRIGEKAGDALSHPEASALPSAASPALAVSAFASASSSSALPLFPASSSSRSVSVLSRAKAKRQFDQLPPSMQYRYLQSVGVDDRLSVRSSTIHGQGLFANVPLAEGEPVIEYVGDMVRNCVSDLREALYEKQGGGGDGACYMFRLDDNFVVDATRAGNVSRFINHSCEPNCTCRILVCEAGQKHIVIIAKTAIRAGEEITYDYQFGIGNETDKLACLCGARTCLGRMN